MEGREKIRNDNVGKGERREGRKEEGRVLGRWFGAEGVRKGLIGVWS